ncbi:MAG: YggS family pyridoxal phosphate-dependent enzyme [Pelagibacterales bacterium]|nr:YggS family pyridoxal phosphate-dependent enzyme [Pelagibacterales bacterium]
MLKKNKVIDNLKLIKKEINEACTMSKRKVEAIKLVAVSKTIESLYICEAAKYGQIAFGENKVQEAKKKWPQIKSLYPKTRLHMIGPLQSNKVKEAIEIFDVIETIDREKIAVELKKHINNNQSLPKLYVQVNIGEEAQKNGCSPVEAKSFINNCISYGLNITGIMGIPPLNEEPAPYFALLTKIAKDSDLNDISMGMSNDFEKAIYLGATSIRVGTKIFGERKLIKVST